MLGQSSLRLSVLAACLNVILSFSYTASTTHRVRTKGFRQPKATVNMIGDLHEPLVHAMGAMDSLIHSVNAHASLGDVPTWHSDAMQGNGLFLSDESVGSAIASPPPMSSSTDVSVYSKVDKTGFIGFFANGIEISIDFVHSLLNGIGVKYSYGFSIIIFTLLG